MLVIGESKAGKSLLGVSGPAPRLLLDVESAARFLPLRPIAWDPKSPVPKADPSWDTAVVSVKHWDDARRALDQIQSRPHPFNSATLDSVSELQYRNIEKVAGGEQPKLQDWGTIYREVGSFCRQLRDMTEHPNHPLTGVIVTSMAKLGEDKIWRPFLQGQMQTVIPYLFDIIAFLEKKRVLNGKNWDEVRDLYTEEVMPKRFIAGGRITGRIDSPLRLPLVTGTTIPEIAKKNTTFRAIIRDVFAMHAEAMVAAKPVPAAEPQPVPAMQGEPK
jgi:hypothetical protein